MREYLDHLGLRSFVKTSGGKGLHVVVPIERRSTWDDVATFTRAVAQTIAGAAPRAFTASSTTDRTGRIYIDHLRNRQSATSVAPYSLRARPEAGVSTPLSWDELDHLSGPAAFTIRTFPPRLALDDPWHDLPATRQRLTRKMIPPTPH